MELKQYQIILVNLNPTLGTEMNKTRPCVIVSPDEMNKYLKTIVIVPITCQMKSYPTRFIITNKDIIGSMVFDQLRTIDKLRTIKIIGNLNTKDIINTKQLIREIFVD
jgi:mRNA interferase MazF